MCHLGVANGFSFLVVNYTLLLDSQEKTEKRLVTEDSSGVDKSQSSDSVTLTRGNTTCFNYVVAVQVGRCFNCCACAIVESVVFD